MPKLVIFPGMDGTGELLDSFVRELDGQIAVSVVSYPREVPLTYEELAAHVLPQVQEMARFIVLGESFGGPLAVMVADSRPRGLVGVVLCASFARFPVQSLRSLAPLVGFAPVLLPPRWLMSWLLLGRWATASVLDRLAPVIGQISPNVWRTRARAALEVDVRDLVARLGVPLLWLRAVEDRVIPLSAAEVPLGSGRVVDVQAPHFMLQCEPSKCAELVLSFARSAEF